MADVTWVKVTTVGNADCFEVAFDSTDKTSETLQLDPEKETTYATKVTGSATVDVTVYLEDPDNGSAVAFTHTTGATDSLQSALGPIAGIDFAGTVTGTDTATIQVLQSQKKS